MERTLVDDESIIGDECHIVSAVSGGPRHDRNFPQEKVNDYSNLLLLCKVHHKLVDDQEVEYSALRLTKTKMDHEKWVSEQLDSSTAKAGRGCTSQVLGNSPDFLHRIRSGREVLDIVTNTCAFASYYDDLRNEEEDELVAGFLQNAQDWGELGLESVGDRMRAARSIDEEIRELEEAGFWVFGGREKQSLQGGVGSEVEWPVAHVRVLRSSNPEIIVVDDCAKQGE